MGIIQDAHLTGEKFNWLGAVFYIGNLAFECPANIALPKLLISKFLSSQIILWGAVAMVMVRCPVSRHQAYLNFADEVRS